MSIKIICNLCDKETKPQDEFLFEATIIETTPALIGESINIQKQQTKKIVHICKDCYNKNIKKLLYGKEKK